MQTYEQLKIFPMDSLSKSDQLAILDQDLENLKMRTAQREQWLNDNSNYSRINYEHVARCVREDQESIKTILLEIDAIKKHMI